MAAQEAALSAHDVFPHIRIVMGMVIGLGVTRLLSGVARIIQHPGQYRLYPVHLAWVGSVLLMLVHFWWWEFGLYRIDNWTFGIYLFIVAYAVVLFLLCALLFPDSMQDYRSYEDYFYEQRGWFFGLLAVTYLLDIIDTLLKGEAHFARFGNEYLIRTPVMVGLCIAAILSRDRRFHMAFVACAVLASITGLIYTARQGSLTPLFGTSMMLPAYAATFLGYVTLANRRFNILGTVIGVYIIGTGSLGLLLVGAPAYSQQLFAGAVLIAATGGSRIRHLLGK